MTGEIEKHRADKEVQMMTSQALILKKTAEGLEIISDEIDYHAKNLLVQIGGIKKGLEGLRKKFVAPLNEHVKNINAFFQKQSNPVIEADKIVRLKVGKYFREKQEVARKEMERQMRLAAKRQETADIKAQEQGFASAPAVVVPVPPSPEKTTRTETGSVTMKKRWDFRVVDENLVPREYLVPDPAKLRAVVKAGIRNIPGIVIFETEDVAVR